MPVASWRGVNGYVRSFRIPIPPMNLQDEFSQVWKKTDLSKKRMLVGKSACETLFQSLTQAAFRGELSPVEVP